MLWTNCLVQWICWICIAWSLFYICWGSTSKGKSWFKHEASDWLSSEDNGKAAVPILTLALPLLVSGTVCALLLLSTSSSSGGSSDDGIIQGGKRRRPKSSGSSVAATLPHQLPAFVHRTWYYICSIRYKLQESCCSFQLQRMPKVFWGDVNMDWMGVILFVVPFCLYAFASIHRHLAGRADDDEEYKVKEVGNAFGMAATVALAVLLVPVSSHSPILQALGVSQARAIRLHHWTGRFVVTGGLLHGALHSYRWTALQGYGYMEKIMPPKACWNLTGEEDKDCYEIFRNLTGVLAGVSLIVLAVTTLRPIRRGFYTLFWTSHIVAGPLFFIFVILHYNKAILYVSGGLLYYLAATIPVWLETKKSATSSSCGGSNQRGRGVPIVAVQRIPGHGDNDDSSESDSAASGCTSTTLISVTIQVDEVAVERFRAGQYVRLVAPEISSFAHPFTINACSSASLRRQGQDSAAAAAAAAAGSHQCMRIIFRTTGRFTKQVAQRLLQSATAEDMPMPCIQMDGFYGTPHRLRTALLQHDVILIVAGGIGITPYLSFLQQLHQNLVASLGQENSQEEQQPLGSSSPFRTKRVILHWMCRDAGLIDYIKREYLSPLLDSNSAGCGSNSGNGFGMQLVIHQTGATAARATSFRDNETRNPQDNDENRNSQESPNKEQAMTVSRMTGVPFRPSKFAAGTKTSCLANAPLFLSFCLIGWGGLMIIWCCFVNLHSTRQVMSRSYSLVLLVVLSLVVAVVLNCLFTPAWEDRREDSFYSAVSTTMSDPTEQDDEDEETAAAQASEVEMARRNGSSPASQQSRTAHAGGLDDASFSSDDLAPGCLVTLEERSGRPYVREFLHAFDSSSSSGRASYPAVYSCGPNELTRSIRVAVKERHCRMCFQKRIALYQEFFEM